MIESFDTKIDIVINIINTELGLNPIEIKRFSNGYRHNVYYVKTDNNEFIKCSFGFSLFKALQFFDL